MLVTGLADIIKIRVFQVKKIEYVVEVQLSEAESEVKETKSRSSVSVVEDDRGLAGVVNLEQTDATN